MTLPRRQFLTLFLSMPALTGLTHKIIAPSPETRMATKSKFVIAASQILIPPSTRFNLTGWKLQIPGPQEIINLQGYASPYFYLNSSNQMCFWVDCTETGYTANADYVRSELRHLTLWKVTDSLSKTLSATLKINANASPNQVTVMQIHGISSDGSNVPPLLRIAFKDQALVAFIKTDSSGTNTESIVLEPNLGTKTFSCVVKVQNKRLVILLNGSQKVARNVSFWPYDNYFKAGCYPQANLGTATVLFSKLSVNTN